MTTEHPERISRYLDGEMDAAERAAFEQEMEQSPRLAADCAAWHKLDIAIAGDLAALLAAEPMPDLPRSTLAPVPVTDLAHERRWREDARPAARKVWRFTLPASIAAGAAGLMLFNYASAPGSSAVGLQVLENLPTSQTAQLTDGTSLEAVLTFAAADGRWCREYAVSDGTHGIACRQNGIWVAVAQEQTPHSESGAAIQGGFATASGENLPAIDQAYDRLAASDPLAPAAEQALIQSGWTGPSD